MAERTGDPDRSSTQSPVGPVNALGSYCVQFLPRSRPTQNGRVMGRDRFPSSSLTPRTQSDGRLFYTGNAINRPGFPNANTGLLGALDAPVPDPELLWISEQLQTYVSSMAAVTTDRIYVGATFYVAPPGTFRGYLYALYLATGTIVAPWPVEFKDGPDSASPALAANSMVYFMAPTRTSDPEPWNNVYIHAFTTTGALLWRSLVDQPVGTWDNGALLSIAGGTVCAGNSRWGLVSPSDAEANPFLLCLRN